MSQDMPAGGSISPIAPVELAALASGLHSDPYAFLGPHDGEVRVYAPGARAVAALDGDGARIPLREQGQGLFLGRVPYARPGDGASYRLAIQWPDAEQITADPYA
ncbi:1,4-alpha-glucan branching enzyme, partial [Achromobacter xylosoxidans]